MHTKNMKIKKEIYESILNDAKIILAKTGFDLKNADKGESGIKPMYSILNEISFNRAYPDSHPTFASGKKERLLNYDGRDYCFYYSGACNDDHLATALKAIQEDLLK